MTNPDGAADTGILDRVDRLYEFEREPVSADRFESPRHFAAVFAGEHVAGTEFVIGALFVSWGVGARDLIVGLIVGNLLAVLSWTFICAPLAVETRLTLYWYLRRIAGPIMTAIYNLMNAVLFCVLAGTMITVSASAIRIPLGIPSQVRWYPQNVQFVLVVCGVGAVVVTVAILGFHRLAQFSTICVPWMFVMFIAGAVAMLPGLAAGTPEIGSITSWDDLSRLAALRIWVQDPHSQFTFWHVAAFAWICNLAFHLGLSDMAVLRYAPRAWYGIFSACGMYLGHFLAWLCAGVMGGAVAALLNRPLADLDAGEVAWQSLGLSGILCVILAGWATSNPTLYRAGLALQTITPGWPRWLVTLLAGVFTTAVACFPFVFSRLLEFVALFGILLAPMGAIVFAEHRLFPRLGLTRFWSSRRGDIVNVPALICWLAAVGAAVALSATGTLDLFFVAIPIWVATVLVYPVLAAFGGARARPPENPRADRPGEPDAELPPAAPPAPRRNRLWTKSAIAAAFVAALSLAACLVLPFSVYAGGALPLESRLANYYSILAVASTVHLIAAGFWVLKTEG